MVPDVRRYPNMPLSEPDAALMASLDAEHKACEQVRDGMAAWVRLLVVECLNDGTAPEVIAEAIWGPVNGTESDARKDRRARLTRIRQFHLHVRRNGTADPESTLPAELVARVNAVVDVMERMALLEREKQAVIDRYNDLAREVRHLVMRLDSEGFSRSVLAKARGCSEARIATMVNRAKEEAGIPVPPQRGGRRPGNSA